MLQLNPIVRKLLGFDETTRTNDEIESPEVSPEINSEYERLNMKNMEDAASQWLHVRELKNNAVFNDNKFSEALASVGHKKGEPYCAYFAKKMALDSVENDEEKRLVQSVLTPNSVQSYYNAAKRGMVSDTPTPNSIAIFQRGNTRSGHTAVVTKVLPDGRYETIEGNTTGAGGREGDGVYRRIRKIVKGTKGLNTLGFITFGK